MKKNTICRDCQFNKTRENSFNCILLGHAEEQKECDHYLPPVGRYDEINSVRDLLSEIAHHGFSTQQHDRNRAADILGNTSVGELAELANSADEIGNMTIGSRFYNLLFAVWHWGEATRFFNEHTLKVNGLSLRQIQEANRELNDDREAAWKKVNELEENIKATAERASGYAYKIDDLGATIKQKEDEIVALKAKLYDMLTVAA